MRNSLALAVALALAACASVDKPATNGNGATAQSAAGLAKYCWKERLSTQGDALVCNWESNTHDACRATYDTSIPKSAVSSGPTDVKRCENGQWLVQVTMK